MLVQRVDPSFYKYVEKQLPDQTISGIMLLKPEKWAGFVLSYTGGKFGKVEDKKIPVHFDFQILDNRPNITDEEMEGVEFTKLLGDIFVDIVEQVMADKGVPVPD